MTTIELLRIPSAGRSRVERTARRVHLVVRSSPGTTVYLAALLVSTLLMRFAVRNPDAVLRWASTNVLNLSAHPVQAFVTSAFVLPQAVWLPYAVVLGASMGLIERRHGLGTAVAVFASAHIGATLLTEGGVGVAVAAGWRPVSELAQVDVGVSYGMAACVGLALGLLPVRYRRAVTAAVVLLAAADLLAERDMTSMGHLISLLVGLAWRPVLLRRRRPAPEALGVG